MGYLAWNQVHDYMDRAIQSGITYDVSQYGATFKWSAYILFESKQFINDSGEAASALEAKAACESHYLHFFNIARVNIPCDCLA
jgi:hypothetical protein